MKYRRSLIAGCATVSVLWAWGALADTLPEAIAYAYEADPGLGAQRAALRGLDEGYTQARAGMGTSITLTIGGQDQTLERGADDNVFSQPNNTQSRGKTDFESLTLSQPLYVGGRATARMTGAEAQSRAGRESLRRFELDLILRVVSAYSSVRRDEEVVRISTDAVKVLETQFSATQSKFDVRQVTATDLAQSRARLAAARTNLTLSQAALFVSRSQYLSVVGKNPTDLAPEPPLHELPKTYEQALDIAERNNPQLLSAGFTEQSSRAQVAEARAVRRPNVSLRVEGRRGQLDPSRESSSFTESVTSTLSLTQPLFTSGAINAQIRQSIAQNERDKLNIEAVRKQVIQLVAESWENLSAARKSLVTLEDEMKANEVAFYGVREEERFALRTTLDVLNAEAELRSAQLNLVRARSTEYVRRVQLMSAVGSLDVRTLAAGVTPYDPEKNFDRVKNKGQTPLEPLVRAFDRIGGAPIPPPRPATREGTRPATSSDLPPPPPDAADVAPIVPTSELVARRKAEGAAAGGGSSSTAPAPTLDADPIAALLLAKP